MTPSRDLSLEREALAPWGPAHHALPTRTLPSDLWRRTERQVYWCAASSCLWEGALWRPAWALLVLTQNLVVGGGLLVTEGLVHHFRAGGGVQRGGHAKTDLVDGVSFGLWLLIWGRVKVWPAKEDIDTFLSNKQNLWHSFTYPYAFIYNFRKVALSVHSTNTDCYIIWL